MVDGSRPSNAEIAALWRTKAFESYAWRPAPNRAGAGVDPPAQGESGGLFVQCDELPHRRAYMKPTRRSTTIRRAAREKIASDLAADLGVVVPPVVLASRETTSEEQHVAVSLVMYPRQQSWHVVRRLLGTSTDVLRVATALSPQVAAAWVFDTWLDQRDHNDDSPGNILLGYTSAIDDGSFVFLDYAFSLGHLEHWSSEKYLECKPSVFPELLRRLVTRRSLNDTVEKIAAFPDDDIESIVSRVPITHMGSDEKALLITALKARRSLLKDAFAKVEGLS